MAKTNKPAGTPKGTAKGTPGGEVRGDVPKMRNPSPPPKTKK